MATTIGKFGKAQRISRTYWFKALDFDGIREPALFVIFSKDNPFAPLHDRAVKLKVKYGLQAGIYRESRA